MDYLLLLYSNEEGWTSMTPEQQQQDVQLLNGFLTTIAEAQFVPGVYINNKDRKSVV